MNLQQLQDYFAQIPPESIFGFMIILTGSPGTMRNRRKLNTRIAAKVIMLKPSFRMRKSSLCCTWHLPPFHELNITLLSQWITHGAAISSFWMIVFIMSRMDLVWLEFLLLGNRLV